MLIMDYKAEMIGDEDLCPYCDGYLDGRVCRNPACCDGVDD